MKTNANQRHSRTPAGSPAPDTRGAVRRGLRRSAADAAGPRVSGPAPGDDIYSKSRLILGGSKFWPALVRSRSEVHDRIVKGVPYGSLVFLVNNVRCLDEEDVSKALGISTRTLRRQAESPEKSMPADLASKTWQFAETLAKATDVFGGKDEAERWMSTPAVGLDGMRPVDLLRTLQGAELVSDFLGRLEYGVYA